MMKAGRGYLGHEYLRHKYLGHKLRRLTRLRNEIFEIIKNGGKLRFFCVLLPGVFVFGLIMNVGWKHARFG